MESDETEFKKNVDTSIPKLVLKPVKKHSGRRADVTAINAQSYAFYLGKKNVTPLPLDSTTFVRMEEGDMELLKKQDSNFMKETAEQHTEADAINYFLHGSADTANSLLREVFTKYQYNNDVGTTEYKAGPDMINQHEVIGKGYEIELTESDTIFLLQFRGDIAVEGDGDYERVLQENGRHREISARPKNLVESSTQTVNTLMERDDRASQSQNSSSAVAGTQVAVYNLLYEYDVNKEEDSDLPVQKQNKSLVPVDSDDVLYKREQPRIDTRALAVNAMIMERVLASNSMGRRQLMLNEDLPYRTLERGKQCDNYECVFVYRCGLGNEISKNLTARCLDWNTATKHLLAVGYGKFFYDYNETPGAVAVWSIKNPQNPERFYEFNKSVTCLKFFVEKPNFLAIGFYCGNVLIIDITSTSLNIIFDKSVQFSGIDPILDLYWTFQVNIKLPDVIPSESLVTCDGNGRVASYSYIHNLFEEKELVQLDEISMSRDTKIERTNLDKKFKLERYQSATRFMEFDQSVYFVGTGGGTVNICSYHSSRNKNIRKINAHFGSINSLECSPYSKPVFLTSARDRCINIWVGYKLKEPVLILNCEKHVEKAIWSPTRSTIIASIAENTIQIWDLALSFLDPVVVHDLEPKQKPTDIKFTPNGFNICVSDVFGYVNFFTLAGVPVKMINPERSLMMNIAKSVEDKKYLVAELCKEQPEYVEIFKELQYRNQKENVVL